MKRFIILVALLVLLVPSVLIAQSDVTLEGLAKQVSELSTNQRSILRRLSALETRTAPTPTRRPTRRATRKPTSTPRPTRRLTSTPRPTRTPTSTPVPETVLVVTIRANARSGPGTEHSILGLVNYGTILQGPLQETSDWYQFCCIVGNQKAWIAKSLVTLKGKWEFTEWERLKSNAVLISGGDLLRYNESHVGKLVYYDNVHVGQSLEDALLIYLVDDEHEDPLILIYSHKPLRIIEGDRIEFVAEVVGLFTYETSGQGFLTVPLLRNRELRLIK